MRYQSPFSLTSKYGVMNSVKLQRQHQMEINALRKLSKKRRKQSLHTLSLIAKGLSYKSFLKSKYWKRVRVIVLKRDKFSCAICKSSKNLEAHHDTYKNHGQEHKNLSDLITLCHSCHEDYHKNIKAV